MLPDFESHFVNAVATQVKRRRKALSYKGKITCAGHVEDKPESLEISVQFCTRLTIIFIIEEGQVVYLWIRSNKRHNRGKILYQRTLMVMCEPKEIMQAMECSIQVIGEYATHENIPCDMLNKCWRALERSCFDERGEGALATEKNMET